MQWLSCHLPAAHRSDVLLYPKASQMSYLYSFGCLLRLTLGLSGEKKREAPFRFPDLTVGSCCFQRPENQFVMEVTMLAPSLLYPLPWSYLWHPGCHRVF